MRAPWHLWVVGLIAVLFNGFGVYDFTMSMTQGHAYLESMGMNAEQIAYYDDMPGWMIVVWAVGVLGAFVASVLLILRKKSSAPVFLASLAAFLLSLVYTYGIAGAGEIVGSQSAVVSGVIAVTLVLFTWYPRAMTQRGVLN